MLKKTKQTRTRNKAEFVYKVRYLIKTLPYHLLVMGSVFIVSMIFDKWLEAICFLIAFFSLRYKFETTYHCDSIVWCMVFTNLIFALSIIICPPIYMYIFASMIFAYVDCLILWLIQDRKEKQVENIKLEKELDVVRDRLDKFLEETKKDPKEELLRECAEAKLTNRDTKLAIMYYYERMTPKDIWLWLCQQKEYDPLEWDSVRQTLWRIGKKLNKKEEK